MSSGFLTRRSAWSYAETIERLLEAIEKRGLQLFAQVDHAAAASAVGLELANEKVVLFGNPKVGTPLMRSDPRIGIELPLRVLVWEDEQGTALGYRDPREAGAGYEVEQHRATLEAMAALLEELIGEAAG